MASGLKLRHVRRKPGLLSYRYVSGSTPAKQQGSAQLKTDSSSSTSKPSIPLVPRHRDPHAVLRALSSTILPLEHPHTMGRSLADPLSSRSRKQLIEFKMFQRVGQNAAKHFIKKFPDLVPLHVAVPNLKPKKNADSLTKEHALQYLILSEALDDALLKYEELKEEGVSLETQNGLLSLLAFKGEGNKRYRGGAPAESSVKQDGLDANELKELAREEAEIKLTLKNQSQWSLDNAAEKLFAEMKERDGITYSAMIQGVVKFRDYERAFQLFTEAREKGLRLNTDGYNHILQVIAHSPTIQNRWKMATNILKTMSERPVVRPNNTTFNLLLEICDNTATAEQVMREMNHLGLRPDLTTLLRLLQIFLKHKEYGILEFTVAHIENNIEILTTTRTTDLLFFPAAMKIARMIPSRDLAMRLNNLAKRDNWYLVQPIGLFISQYLVAITINQADMTEIKKAFNEIVPKVCVPYAWVYYEIFKQCGNCSDVDSAIFFWKEFIKFQGVVDKIETLHELVAVLEKGLESKEKLPKIMEVVNEVWKKIEYYGFKPTQKIISTTIRTYIKSGQLETAWKFYQSYDLAGYTAGKILLEAYVEKRDHDVVLFILKKMMNKGFCMNLTEVVSIANEVLISEKERLALIDGFTKNLASKTNSLPESIASIIKMNNK